MLSCPGKEISLPAWVSDTRWVLDTIRPVGLTEKEEECMPLASGRATPDSMLGHRRRGSLWLGQGFRQL